MTAPLSRHELAAGHDAEHMTAVTNPPPIVYTLSIVADSTSWTVDEGDAYDLTWTLTIGGGTQANCYVTIYWQDSAAYNDNAIDREAELAASNPGWTVLYVTDFGSYWAAQLHKATIPVGASTIFLPFAPLYDGVGDYDAGVYGPISATAQSDQCPTPSISADAYLTVNAPAPSYTIDATSGKACPANLTEHAAFETAVGSTMGNPDGIYLFDEASGTIQDKVSTRHLSVSGGATYAQAVSGWARLALSLTTGNSVNTVACPNANANSITAIFYAVYTGTITVSGNILLYGTSQVWQIRSTAAPVLQYRSGGNVNSGGNDYRNQVRPFVLRIDRAGSNGNVYSNQDKISTTFASTPTGSNVASGGAGASQQVYGIIWYGAKSEAQCKAWLQGAGWTIPW